MKKAKLHKRIFLAAIVFIILIGAYKSTSYLAIGHPGHNIAIFIDDWIEFSPEWVVFYILYYPGIVLPFLFIKNQHRIMQLFWGFLFVIFLTVPFYLFFIVRIARPDVIDNGFFSRIVKSIFASDEPVNLFPSQHVAFIWLTAFIFNRENRIFGIGYFVFAVLVSLSTVFIKQHYFLDIPSGIAIAILSYYLSKFISEQYIKHSLQ
ncbi:MAG: phosphatase PAP2 family protein [Candidatus Zixiibacteriota bacterium]